MADKKSCPYCGSAISSADMRCPRCGATVENSFSPEKGASGNTAYETIPLTEEAAYEQPLQEEIITHPTTIAELQQYCVQKGMPLLRMRFFIGEDYKEPRAFGIYRDKEDFVVYKNKDTGVRAIRYRGPDEAYAVNEIFQKLLSECHLRGIYPDGDERAAQPVSRGYKQKSKASEIGLAIGVFGLIGIIAIALAIGSYREHKEDGYYRIAETVYYRYGDEWSMYDPVSQDWTTDGISFPYDDYSDYSIGKSYSGDWYSEYGISNIEDSDVWDTWKSYSDSSGYYDSSYDSWDSSSTDWSSDW
ncbi:MAG: hypothetical protein J5643_01505 [Lachnospiraceae bacterium]|nr:hypothetical protein [Lachnospiraceae bacterium]